MEITPAQVVQNYIQRVESNGLMHAPSLEGLSDPMKYFLLRSSLPRNIPLKEARQMFDASNHTKVAKDLEADYKIPEYEMNRGDDDEKTESLRGMRKAH